MKRRTWSETTVQSILTKLRTTDLIQRHFSRASESPCYKGFLTPRGASAQPGAAQRQKKQVHDDIIANRAKMSSCHYIQAKNVILLGYSFTIQSYSFIIRRKNVTIRGYNFIIRRKNVIIHSYRYSIKTGTKTALVLCVRGENEVCTPDRVENEQSIRTISF